MSTPKVVYAFLAKYVEERGEEIELNIYTSSSVAPELDGSLARTNAIRALRPPLRRAPTPWSC